MSKVLASKTVLAMFALLVCAGMLQATTPATPLTATPNSVSVSYVVGTGAGTAVPVVFKATNSTSFFVDTTSVPFWLTLDNVTGTADASGATINFNALPSGASTLASGSYNASVHVKASGFADLVLPVTLVVSDPTSTMSVTDSAGALTDNTTTTATKTIHWTPGTAIPTETLTVASSNEPISFTVAPAVTAPTSPSWISTSVTSGIAYNFGAAVTVNFLSDTLNNAVSGLTSGAVTLSGTVTVTPAGGTAQVITINIVIDEPPAVVTSIFPSQTPVLASGTLTVVVSGNYFGTTGGYSAKKTAVKVTYGGHGPTDLTTITGGAVAVSNPSTLVLTIPAKDASNNAILSAAQAVTLTIQNGNLGTAQTQTLTVTNNPIIYTVTDAASLVEAATGSNPNVAPYELITIFGDNFGPTAGTPVLGSVDTYSKYPNSLTANSHAVTVTFNDGSGNLIQDARLLFATNNQINAMVPAAVAGVGQVQILVNYNGNSSTAFIANVVPANPGLFTIGASGQGQGAILLSNYTVNSNSSNSTKAAKGGTVLLYLSGMGAPDSTSANTASTKAAVFPTSCIAATTGTTSYFATVNTNLSAGWVLPGTTLPGTVGNDGIDGAVILSSQLTSGHFPPCFATKGAVSVTIGGQSATVTYAGWVADSVDGLYQINVTVPTKAASSDTSPVVVSVKSGTTTYTSQSGVTMAIQ